MVYSTKAILIAVIAAILNSCGLFSDKEDLSEYSKCQLILQFICEGSSHEYAILFGGPAIPYNGDRNGCTNIDKEFPKENIDEAYARIDYCRYVTEDLDKLLAPTVMDVLTCELDGKFTFTFNTNEQAVYLLDQATQNETKIDCERTNGNTLTD